MRKRFDYASPAARRSYLELPEDIQSVFGFALKYIQMSDEGNPDCPKIIFSYRDGIQELKESDDQNLTYRCMYYAKFEEAIYILHSFNKKSHHGIATDLNDQDIIKDRMKLAKEKHDEYLKLK